MSRKRRSLLGLVIGVLLVGAIATPAHANTPSYPIKSYYTLKCLDNDTGNAQHVQQWSCNNQSQQSWYEVYLGDLQDQDPKFGAPSVFRFGNVRTQLCLEEIWNGAAYIARMDTCSDTNANEQWEIIYNGNNDGSGWVLKARGIFDSTGECLAHSVLSSDGVAITLEPCDVRSWLQRWFL
jgi:hypothetical protein